MFTEEDRSLLSELIDREKIRDCIMRYATGIDRCDPEILASAYWPDAHDVHGDFEGSGEEFVEFMIPALRRLERTQHFHGNSTIRIDGDRANVQTYTINWHTVRDFAGNLHDVIHAGRYLDVFEKRGSEWRILDRMVMFDWVMENAETVDFSKGVLGQTPAAMARATSKRGNEDPLYTFLGGVPIGGYLGENA